MPQGAVSLHFSEKNLLKEFEIARPNLQGKQGYTASLASVSVAGGVPMPFSMHLLLW
jgi:hypothetical protein